MSDRRICRGCKRCREPWIDFVTHFYCKECIDALKEKATVEEY